MHFGWYDILRLHDFSDFFYALRDIGNKYLSTSRFSLHEWHGINKYFQGNDNNFVCSYQKKGFCV